MPPTIRAINLGQKKVNWVIDIDDEIMWRVFSACAPAAIDCDLSDALGRKRQSVLVDLSGLPHEKGIRCRVQKRPPLTTWMTTIA